MILVPRTRGMTDKITANLINVTTILNRQRERERQRDDFIKQQSEARGWSKQHTGIKVVNYWLVQNGVPPNTNTVSSFYLYINMARSLRHVLPDTHISGCSWSGLSHQLRPWHVCPLYPSKIAAVFFKKKRLDFKWCLLIWMALDTCRTPLHRKRCHLKTFTYTSLAAERKAKLGDLVKSHFCEQDSILLILQLVRGCGWRLGYLVSPSGLLKAQDHSWVH